MKTIDLGRKIGTEGLMKANSRVSTTYPSFSVEGISLPLGSNHVGKTIKAVVELKVLKAGPEIEEYGDKKKRHRARFEVRSMSFPGKVGQVADADMTDEAEEQEFNIMHGKGDFT